MVDNHCAERELVHVVGQVLVGVFINPEYHQPGT